MRKYLAKLDCNNMLINKTTTDCWKILKFEIENIIDIFPMKSKESSLERSPCQNKLLENSVHANYVDGL